MRAVTVLGARCSDMVERYYGVGDGGKLNVNVVDPVHEEELDRVQMTTSVLLTNVHGPKLVDLLAT